ncbi:muscle M-line assembly protein unc-89-like [Acropora palmata]|uniref:muscle M-line assembly protein unc-89-like n=1 Tax=Acropora palmata TaxID=6131 RepID=UPI003DA18AFA
MAASKFFLSLMIFLTSHGKSRAQNFGIVEPFPDNLYPIEFQAAMVTCVAFDSAGLQTPEKILFVRKNQFAEYTELKSNDNLELTNRTELVVVGEGADATNTIKLFVTLHIRNVTLADDSQYGALGRYECHAYAVNATVSQKHGFSVNVIRQFEIPKVSVSESRTVEHNSSVVIMCNLTEDTISRQRTPLKRISWYKNGELLQSVRNPDPQVPKDFLSPLDLQSVTVKDGGTYECLVEVLLRKVKNYNISKTTELRIAPWFTQPEEDIEFKKFKEETAQFICAAQGNPLEVEWKVHREGEDTVQACINGSDGKYEVKRNGIYDPYYLVIKDLQYTDRGSYYCCLPSNCSDAVDDNCQRFVLKVTTAISPAAVTTAISPSATYLAAFFLVFLKIWGTV